MSPFTKDTCPDRAQHTPEPSGYLAWHEWAEEKSKTHKQRRCATCGLFVIWVPRRRRSQTRILDELAAVR